ncbi:MAG: TolC family protein [Sandaracinaceae bacterium]|nr:TolC family protein [Sandaracinaceae bacterium]
MHDNKGFWALSGFFLGWWPALLLAQAPGGLVPASEPQEAADEWLVSFLEALRSGGHPLDAEEVARLALLSAPGLTEAQARLEQARAGAREAFLAFFPRIETFGRYTRLNPVSPGRLGEGITSEQEAALRGLIANVQDPSARLLFEINLQAQLALANFRFPVILDVFSFGAGLRYPLSDVLLQVLPAYEATERLVEAQRAQIEAQALEIAWRAREAFYQYLRARASLALAEELLHTIESQKRVVEAAVAIGAAPRVDLVRIEAQRASAEVAVERARGGVGIALMALRTLIHEESATEFAIREDLLGEVAAPSSFEGLVETAMRERPEFRALRQLVEARSREAEAALGSRYPHLFLDAQLSFDNPNQRIIPLDQRFVENYAITFALAWSPNDIALGEARAERALASRNEHLAQLEQLRDGLRIELSQAFEAQRAARLAVEAAKVGLKAAEEVFRVRSEQHRQGAIGLTELTIATSERTRARMELLNALIDFRIATARLQRVLGRDPVVREHLQKP